MAGDLGALLGVVAPLGADLHALLPLAVLVPSRRSLLGATTTSAPGRASLLLGVSPAAAAATGLLLVGRRFIGVLLLDVLPQAVLLRRPRGNEGRQQGTRGGSSTRRICHCRICCRRLRLVHLLEDPFAIGAILLLVPLVDLVRPLGPAAPAPRAAASRTQRRENGDNS